MISSARVRVFILLFSRGTLNSSKVTLKTFMTLKTEKFQLCHHRNKLHLKYIKTDSYFKLYKLNITH